MGRAIERGAETDWFCVCFEFLGLQCREDMTLNFILFFVKLWGVQYREELLLNVTV